jgi:hypothetical protein
MESNEYVLGHASHELERLVSQGTFLGGRAASFNERWDACGRRSRGRASSCERA